MSEQTSLGFHYKVELDWLDGAATLVSTGATVEDFRAHVDAQLRRDPDVDLSERGRSKAIGVMLRMWLEVPPSIQAARGDALRLVATVLPEERLAVHWAMATATFPFFYDVGAATGRLTRLQGQVDIGSVKRRIAESWGERSTVERAAGIVVGTIRDWGAVEGSTRVVTASKPLPLPFDVSALLVECLLLGSRTTSLSIADAVHHPALFPFELTIDGQRLRESERLRIDRLGGEDVLSLAR